MDIAKELFRVFRPTEKQIQATLNFLSKFAKRLLYPMPIYPSPLHSSPGQEADRPVGWDQKETFPRRQAGTNRSGKPPRLVPFRPLTHTHARIRRHIRWREISIWAVGGLSLVRSLSILVRVPKRAAAWMRTNSLRNWRTDMTQSLSILGGRKGELGRKGRRSILANPERERLFVNKSGCRLRELEGNFFLLRSISAASQTFPACD